MDLFHTTKPNKGTTINGKCASEWLLFTFHGRRGEKTCKIIIINMKNACVYDNYTKVRFFWCVKPEYLNMN